MIRLADWAKNAQKIQIYIGIGLQELVNKHQHT